MPRLQVEQVRANRDRVLAALRAAKRGIKIKNALANPAQTRFCAVGLAAHTLGIPIPQDEDAADYVYGQVQDALGLDYLIDGLEPVLVRNDGGCIWDSDRERVRNIQAMSLPKIADWMERELFNDGEEAGLAEGTSGD